MRGSVQYRIYEYTKYTNCGALHPSPSWPMINLDRTVLSSAVVERIEARQAPSAWLTSRRSRTDSASPCGVQPLPLGRQPAARDDTVRVEHARLDVAHVELLGRPSSSSSAQRP